MQRKKTREGLGVGGKRTGVGAALFAGTAVIALLAVLGVAPAKADSPGPTLDNMGIPPIEGSLTGNAGQVANYNVRYYGSFGTVQVGFADSAVLLVVTEAKNETNASVRGVLVRLVFEGSSSVVPQGRTEVHRSHYLLGNDSAAWRTDLRNYQEVVYSNLYNGIDLVYRIEKGGLKQEFAVAPEVDPATIRMMYEGVDGLAIDATGLVIRTALGDLRDSPPIAYADDGINVMCNYELLGFSSLGFRCDGRDPSQRLVIDPLLYSTFLGGAGTDVGSAIAVDSSGNAYVTGVTCSADFPTTPGAFDAGLSGDPFSTGGRCDAFVAKVNPTGQGLAYATFFGGMSTDEGTDIAVDAFGNAYIAGLTCSADFPVTPGAFDTTLGGQCDGFVAKLNPAGSGLVYAAFLSGNATTTFGGIWEIATGIAVDSSGSAYVTGWTLSPDFPITPGALDTINDGAGIDAFVVKVNPAGSALVYSTFLGGKGTDTAADIAVDAAGSAYVTGGTNADFPVTSGAFDTTQAAGDAHSGGDGFVAKLNSTGSGLVYATFRGGVGAGESIAVDSFGNAYVAGGAVEVDQHLVALVTKLNSDGSDVVYATLLPGTGPSAIAVDTSGNAYVTGGADGHFSPTTPGAFDATFNGGGIDAFVLKLDPAGSTFLYKTFLGGKGVDDGRGIAVDASGNAFVTGVTNVFVPGFSLFPTTPGTFDGIPDGMDAFVTKLDTTPPLLDFTLTCDTPGNVPWCRGTLTVSWFVMDPDSAVTSTSGCGTTIINTDTPATGTTLACTATSSGGIAFRSATVFRDGTPPSISSNVVCTDPGSAGWCRGIATVSWTIIDPVSGTSATTGCGLVAVETDGTFPLTCSAADIAGNTNEVSMTILRDATAPTIEASLSPVAPDGMPLGWYNLATGAPTVSFTCSDVGPSGLAFCPPSVTLRDGVSQTVAGTACDFAGNCASASISGINVDLTPPTFLVSVSPTAASTGWYNLATGAPTASFACSDATSGLDTLCPSAVTFTEGAGQSVTGIVCDVAGNCATALMSGINVDLTPPVVTCGMDVFFTGYEASFQVAYDPCTASDALSGLAGSVFCSRPTRFPLGDTVVTCSVIDVAGNVGSDSFVVTGLADGDVRTQGFWKANVCSAAGRLKGNPSLSSSTVSDLIRFVGERSVVFGAWVFGGLDDIAQACEYLMSNAGKGMAGNAAAQLLALWLNVAMYHVGMDQGLDGSVVTAYASAEVDTVGEAIAFAELVFSSGSAPAETTLTVVNEVLDAINNKLGYA